MRIYSISFLVLMMGIAVQAHDVVFENSTDRTVYVAQYEKKTAQQKSLALIVMRPAIQSFEMKGAVTEILARQKITVHDPSLKAPFIASYKREDLQPLVTFDVVNKKFAGPYVGFGVTGKKMYIKDASDGKLAVYVGSIFNTKKEYSMKLLKKLFIASLMIITGVRLSAVGLEDLTARTVTVVNTTNKTVYVAQYEKTSDGFLMKKQPTEIEAGGSAQIKGVVAYEPLFASHELSSLQGYLNRDNLWAFQGPYKGPGLFDKKMYVLVGVREGDWRTKLLVSTKNSPYPEQELIQEEQVEQSLPEDQFQVLVD